MATMIVSPLLARVVGQASRRGLILRVPSGDSLLESVEAWLLAEYGDAVRSTTPAHDRGRRRRADGRAPSGRPELVMTANDTGRVGADRRDRGRRARLSPVHRPPRRAPWRGPVDHVGPRRGRPRAIPDDSGRRSPTGPRPSAATSAGSARRWSRRVPAGRRAATQLQVGIPGSTRYTFDGAIATVLGPRDDAWLDAAVADTRVATDITPWWADATDGQTLLNRALALMWLEVRWRPPAIKEERELLDEVHRTLIPGLPDRSRPSPTRGGHGPSSSRCAASTTRCPARSSTGPSARPATARRSATAARRSRSATRAGRSRSPAPTPSGAPPRSGGAAALGRNITLAAVQTATDGGAMGAQAFVDQFGGDLGPDAIDHRAGGVDRPGAAVDRHELGRRGRRPRRLLGGRRLRCRHQDRVRRPGRLAVGARHVAVARAGLSLRPATTVAR